MPHHERTPKRAGIWENLGASQEDLSKGPSPQDFSTGRVQRFHLVLLFALLGVLLLILDAIEFGNALPVGDDGRRLALVVALLAALFQLVVFALLVLLTIRMRGANPELFWLSLFFGSTLFFAVHRVTIDPLAWYLRSLAISGWSLSLLGYGVSFYSGSDALRRRLDRLCVLLYLGLAAGDSWAYSSGALGSSWVGAKTLVVAMLPFAAYALSVLWWWTDGSAARSRRARPGRSELAILVFLFVLYGLQLAEHFSWLQLPRLVRSPLFLPLVSCLVFYFAVDTLTDALRSLAFYGRFIRPGLKRLLKQEGRSMSGDDKLFRGRKTVIMKVDMANYTRTTFTMPYGMRRLFQDLWFTLIDRVVADKVFLDKSLGDGSVYCLEDGLPGGSCSAALKAALEIRERQVRLFDETFRRQLRQKLDTVAELRESAEVYLEEYRGRMGQSFWERSTLVRIALVSGYVDEGLWGLSSQSHYDVQGGPIILATRMEAAAENGEIVVDRRFLEELDEESPGLVDRSRLERRVVDLKGVGTWEIFALPPRGLPRERPPRPISRKPS
ncbi:MAG: adenylate/guanylate cyclase domain-containing protein [bacterium]|nr:adenylate/guanylate cyclase domain-containing protein [bacterium]